MFGVDIEIIRAIGILKDKGIIPYSFDVTKEVLIPVKKEQKKTNTNLNEME